MKNLGNLMKQAKEMQNRMAEMQASLEAHELTGVSGGGLVKITLNGKGAMRDVKIDASLANPAETEILEDLIKAAHADAQSKVEKYAQEKMREMTGGLDLPPGMNLPF
jgi:hypothetical protein